MNPETREALLRALPYVHPGRRELLTSFLMGERINRTVWLGVEFQLTELERIVYHMLVFCEGKTYLLEPFPFHNWLGELNKAIDEHESRPQGP